MLESPIVTNALKVLKMARILSWRVNSGMLVAHDSDGATRVMRGAPAGTPDIMVIVPGSRGRLGGIEMKRPKTAEHAAGTLRASQERWRDKAEAQGVLYGVVTSANGALLKVREWEKLCRVEGAP